MIFLERILKEIGPSIKYHWSILLEEDIDRSISNYFYVDLLYKTQDAEGNSYGFGNVPENKNGGHEGYFGMESDSYW